MWSRIARLNAVIKSKNSGKLYLFGAGKNGKELLEYLNKYNVPVQAFIDNNKMLDTVCGKDVNSIDEFMASVDKDDFILISCAAYEEVEKQLLELGWENYLHYREVPDIKEYVIDYDVVQSGGRTSWEKAVSWLLKHQVPDGGIAYSNKESRAYPEVTGYLIPTLIDYGYYEEAKACVKWLLGIQEEDGGFADINHIREFVFDSAQILRGFLCFYDDQEIGTQVRRAIERICAYLYFNMVNGGKGGYIRQYEHDSMIPETILLYTLPPFQKAAKLLGRSDYLEAIEQCIFFYEKHNAFLRITDLTHFLAYEIEALIDLGRREKAEGVLKQIFISQMENGAIPSHKNSRWVCTPGAAQLALCELKLGRMEHAEKILKWMRNVQTQHGGFWGSYGSDASYFAGVEIAWAVKYYLDAERLYIEKWFDHNTQDFPEIIEETDARCQLVWEKAGSLGGESKIAEIGCGKGRFIRSILENGFNGKIDGYDISENLLKYLPGQAKGIHGRMENIPCEDNEYDFVFCIEALEHSQNMKSAVSEMARILKPGGSLLIIDKDKSYWGMMRCSVWENWIGKEELCNCMEAYLKDVKVRIIDQKYPYMLAWEGKK